ncbi:MAG: PAS domain S-box protein [Chloroflexi bacterium]|nr:PAS domain S-box protein [Chloroflexota bacterium]
MQPGTRASWFEHAVPLAAIVIALAMLALTPFWALEWVRQPFLGVLLEPNNIVSQIDEAGWPARNMGANWSDQLVKLNGKLVGNADEVSAFLKANGFAPVQAEFVKPTGGAYILTITPIRFPFGSLLTTFIIPYLTGLVFLLTGLWAYRIRSDLRASRAFVTFTAAVSVLTTTFLDMNTTHHAVILWALSISVGAGALAHLALVFPQQMPFVDRRPYLRYIPWLFVLALSAATALELISPKEPLGYVQLWITGYAFILFSMLLFGGTLFVRIVRSQSAIVRQQSRVIIFGSTIAFIPVFTLYLIPIVFSSSIPEFQGGFFFPMLVFLPLSVTYAIVRYRLLDVDRIFSRALAYLLTMGIALGTFYGLIALISYLIEESIGADNPLVIGLFLVILAVGLIPVRDLIQRAIDRLFYRAPADYRRALTSLSRSLVVTPDLTHILRLLEEQLHQALSPERFVIYLYNDEYGQYFPHATREDSAPAYPADEPLVRHIQKAHAPFWLSPGMPLPEDLRGYDRLLGFTFVPLLYEGRLIGFFALGPRRSGELYNSDDLDFLAAVAAQSTLALENARLFANLRRTLDQTLEMKSLMDDIFSSIATGVITTDLAHEITLFNHAAEEILGIPMDQVIGRSMEQAFPSLYSDFLYLTETAAMQGAPVFISEITRIIPARGELALRVSCAPLLDAYRSAKGATIFFEDLTERRKLEAEQERIRQTFGRVVAPRVRDRLLADPRNLRLDGSKETVSILFADLSGFTSYSEKQEPETVFKVLNAYLSLAADAVLKEEGTLDKFMGDAVLAIWNSPDLQGDHALRAVRAAHDILLRSAELHRSFNETEHRLSFRIGVATGSAIIGNVGTSDLFNYTAIGDTVNIAQRLQVTAEPGEILMQKSTYEIVADKIKAEPLEPISVRGREQQVEVYRFMGLS